MALFWGYLRLPRDSRPYHATRSSRRARLINSIPKLTFARIDRNGTAVLGTFAMRCAYPVAGSFELISALSLVRHMRVFCTGQLTPKIKKPPG